jgi:hypothetical protein
MAVRRVSGVQHGRVADDDAPASRQRDGADDRDRDGDEQRTRRYDDEHSQEPLRLTADGPRNEGKRATASGV